MSSTKIGPEKIKGYQELAFARVFMLYVVLSLGYQSLHFVSPHVIGQFLFM